MEQSPSLEAVVGQLVNEFPVF